MTTEISFQFRNSNMILLKIIQDSFSRYTLCYIFQFFFSKLTGFCLNISFYVTYVFCHRIYNLIGPLIWQDEQTHSNQSVKDNYVDKGIPRSKSLQGYNPWLSKLEIQNFRADYSANVNDYTTLYVFTEILKNFQITVLM